MKLIKINEDHYVVVNDSKHSKGDYVLHNNQIIQNSIRGDIDWVLINSKKITHSTIPLDTIVLKNRDHSQSVGHYYGDGGQLSLQEVKELIGEVDVEKKANEEYKDNLHNPFFTAAPMGYIKGYNQALEDNKEKKYNWQDIQNAWIIGYRGDSIEELEQNFQPKTEWEVELVDGKLKLK